MRGVVAQNFAVSPW